MVAQVFTFTLLRVYLQYFFLIECFSLLITNGLVMTNRFVVVCSSFKFLLCSLAADGVMGEGRGDGLLYWVCRDWQNQWRLSGSEESLCEPYSACVVC